MRLDFPGTIITRCFEYTEAPEGFTVLAVRPRAEITLPVIHELLDNLGGHWNARKAQKLPLLSDIRQIKSASREAREIFTQPDSEVARSISGMALLVNSTVSRVIGNFFLGFNKPIFPTRIFTNETASRRWLVSLMESTPPKNPAPKQTAGAA
jgi:hypothetical protein